MVASEKRDRSAMTPATSCMRRSLFVGAARPSSQFCGEVGAVVVAASGGAGRLLADEPVEGVGVERDGQRRPRRRRGASRRGPPRAAAG